MRRLKLDQVQRQGMLLTAAVAVARRDGLLLLTPDAIALEAGCGRSTVYRILGNRKSIQTKVVRAVRRQPWATALLDEAKTLRI